MAAELNEHAFRFLLIANVENVFQSERLKIKFVTRIVIRGNGLRVRVHHDCFESELAQGERGMDTAIIEFNSLTDAIRSATQNHDLAFAALPSLVFVAVRRVVIWRVSFKLRCAGVD